MTRTGDRPWSASAGLFRLLALLALLGQVLAGSLVVPDDASAAEAGAIEAASALCGAPASPRHDHLPTHQGPVCALSLSLTNHAGPLATPAFVPRPTHAVATTTVVRPLGLAPPPRRLGSLAPPARGPPPRA